MVVCLSGEAPDSKQRRLNMIKAVEGDDWSSVIDSQTQSTLEGKVSFCPKSPLPVELGVKSNLTLQVE